MLHLAARCATALFLVCSLAACGTKGALVPPPVQGMDRPAPIADGAGGPLPQAAGSRIGRAA